MTTSLDHRRVARSVALQVLYELDNSTHQADPILSAYANIQLDDSSIWAFAYSAICLYYHDDQLEVPEDNPISDERVPPLTSDDYKMLRRLVTGVLSRREALDKLIAEHAPEWPPDQIAIVDRNILRLAIYELLHEHLPIKVVINEAVEVAKVFGTESTPRFVNGVLGSVADQQTHAPVNLPTPDSPVEPSV